MQEHAVVADWLALCYGMSQGFCSTKVEPLQHSRLPQYSLLVQCLHPAQTREDFHNNQLIDAYYVVTKEVCRRLTHALCCSTTKAGRLQQHLLQPEETLTVAS